MYLTPKFDRKSLALTLVCLILTLVTFGIVFVTYFFYGQTNSLFTVQPIPVPAERSVNPNRKVQLTDSSTVQDVYRSNARRGHRDYATSSSSPTAATVNRLSQAKERKDSSSDDRFGNDIKTNTYILANAKQDRRLRLHYDEVGSSGLRASDQQAGEDAGRSRDSGASANSETIYIDDYDRMLDATTMTNSVTHQDQDGPAPATSAAYAAISDRLDINNIDYFDSILKDRSDAANNNENTPMLGQLMISSAESVDNSPTAAGAGAKRLRKKKKQQRDRGDLNRRRKGLRSKQQQQRPIEATISNKYFTGSRLSSTGDVLQRPNNILATRIPLNFRRPFGRNNNNGHRRRLQPNDGDDNTSQLRINGFVKSDQLRVADDDEDNINDDDDELIGSGSGDFIDEDDDGDDDGLDDLEDTEIYVAIGGEHTGQYRMDAHRRRENAYSVVDSNDDIPSPETVSPTPRRKSSVIGSSLKKWIPPSIVSSSQQSRVVTLPAASTPTTTSTAATLDGATAVAIQTTLKASTTYPPTAISGNLYGKLSQDDDLDAVSEEAIISSSAAAVQQHPQPLSLGGSGGGATDTAINVQLQSKEQQQAAPQHQQLLGSSSSSSAHNFHQNSGAWYETRARRIMGNVKKSEERSRQLLLCAEAGGGELCRMLFKGHLNE